jgi:hypothetical protein
MQKRWKWLEKAASSKNPDQKTNFHVGSKNGARSEFTYSKCITNQFGGVLA